MEGLLQAACEFESASAARNGTPVVVRHRATGRYYRVSERAYAVLEAFRDPVPLEAVIGDLATRLGDEEAENLVKSLIATGLLQEVTKAATPPSPRPDWSAWRIPVASPDPWLDRHRGVVEALAGPAARLVYALILLGGFATLSLGGHELWRSLAARLAPAQWVLVYGLVLVTMVVHELGHALACKYYGARVGKMGVLMFFLQPVPYCDVSDAWRFHEGDKRAAVAFAGIFIQLVLAGLALLAWWPLRSLGRGAAAVPVVYATANIALAIANLNPFVRLDGYWILSHLLDVPNLQARARYALRRLVADPRLPGDPGSRGELALAAYGAGSLAMTAAFWGLGLWGIWRLVQWLCSSLGWIRI